MLTMTISSTENSMLDRFQYIINTKTSTIELSLTLSPIAIVINLTLYVITQGHAN